MTSGKAIVQWAAAAAAVMEQDGSVNLTIMRYGNVENQVLVR
jgi:hypothetical protein